MNINILFSLHFLKVLYFMLVLAGASQYKLKNGSPKNA